MMHVHQKRRSQYISELAYHSGYIVIKHTTQLILIKPKMNGMTCEEVVATWLSPDINLNLY